MICWPGPRLVRLRPLAGSWGGCHGIIHPAVRRRTGVRLPLLRPHCHLRLSERPIAARAGGALLPQRRRRCHGQQRGPQPTHRRLSGLGGRLRPQSSAADRVGRKGSAQGRLCPALATPHGEARHLRRLFHLQEHGAGRDLSRQRAEIPDQRSKLPDPGAPAQPLHALILLHPRCGPRSNRDAGRLLLPVPHQLLPQWSQFHRARTEAAANRLPQSDNAFLAVDDVAALQAAADTLSAQIIRKRLDYWTLILGPKFSAKERKQINLSRFYAIAQIEYCRNFIFKRHFPIHKLFERSCELGLWRLTADRIAEIFGTHVNRRMQGKLATIIDRIEHGHHVFRAYFKHALLKQYEKFSTFLRNELVSNNLADFRLKKGLDHLDAIRERFQTITGRFAAFQAQWLNPPGSRNLTALMPAAPGFDSGIVIGFAEICWTLLSCRILYAASMSRTTMAICSNHSSLLYEGTGIGRPVEGDMYCVSSTICSPNFKWTIRMFVLNTPSILSYSLPATRKSAAFSNDSTLVKKAVSRSTSATVKPIIARRSTSPGRRSRA